MKKFIRNHWLLLLFVPPALFAFGYPEVNYIARNLNNPERLIGQHYKLKLSTQKAGKFSRFLAEYINHPVLKNYKEDHLVFLTATSVNTDAFIMHPLVLIKKESDDQLETMQRITGKHNIIFKVKLVAIVDNSNRQIAGGTKKIPVFVVEK